MGSSLCDGAACFCCPVSDKVGLSVCTKHMLLKARTKLGGGEEGRQEKGMAEKADKTVSPPARPGGQSHVETSTQLCSNLSSSV